MNCTMLPIRYFPKSRTRTKQILRAHYRSLNGKTLTRSLRSILKSMLPSSRKTTAVFELTAELSKPSPKEPAAGKFEQIVDPTDEPRTHHVGTTEAPITAPRTVEPVDHSLPTHPLSPGVLTEFPPFQYAAPPVRPQPRPLQEKRSPLNSSCGRVDFTKKGQPPLLTLSQLASAQAKAEARGDLSANRPQK